MTIKKGTLLVRHLGGLLFDEYRYGDSYSDGIGTYNPPSEAMLATDGWMEPQAQTFDPATHKQVDGYDVIEGIIYYKVIAKTDEEIAADLAAEKSAVHYAIDQAVGSKRTKWLTDAPLQDITYANKARKAREYMAAGFPADLTGYAYIEEEMDALRVANPQTTAQQACEFICGQEVQIDLIGAALEGLRRTAKEEVTIAKTIGEVQAVYSGFSITLDYL